MSLFDFRKNVSETRADGSLYDLKATNITGEETDLGQYRGKVALVVNTASECGFTGQYEDLEKLYEQFKDKGFVILGFPSNDFMGQEPGSNEEIASFCSTKFQITFPLFSKAPVKGAEKQPVYKFLTEQSGQKYAGDPGWNFVKFLVDKDGHVIGRYSSMTKPLSEKIVEAINEALGEARSN